MPPRVHAQHGRDDTRSHLLLIGSNLLGLGSPGPACMDGSGVAFAPFDVASCELSAASLFRPGLLQREAVDIENSDFAVAKCDSRHLCD